MAKRKGRKPYNIKRYYKKRTFNNNRTNRDYSNPAYTDWRNTIKQRDNYMCQWPGCMSTHRLEVHHIKTWSKNPGLRFDIANGITLCKKCHASIKGKEHDYEVFFLKVLEWQMLDKIKKYNREKRNG